MELFVNEKCKDMKFMWNQLKETYIFLSRAIHYDECYLGNYVNDRIFNINIIERFQILGNHVSERWIIHLHSMLHSKLFLWEIWNILFR